MTRPQSSWSHAPHLAFVDDGERVVALRLDALPSQPQLLDGSAAAVWRLLQRPQTAVEVARHLAQDGRTGTLTAEELELFLTELATQGLVRPE